MSFGYAINFTEWKNAENWENTRRNEKWRITTHARGAEQVLTRAKAVTVKKSDAAEADIGKRNYIIYILS